MRVPQFPSRQDQLAQNRSRELQIAESHIVPKDRRSTIWRIETSGVSEFNSSRLLSREQALAVWFLLNGALRVWRAARAIEDGLCDKELLNVISDLQGYTDGHAFDSFKERKHEYAAHSLMPGTDRTCCNRRSGALVS